MNDWIGASRLAVTAGAGAGKTTMLTSRYVRHVLTDGLSPLEIVAVTFTEAAAAELRSRVRASLTEALGIDDDRVAELEAARLCTFHALAASICRQHPAEAGVPPDFDVLDDILGPVWTTEQIDDALDALPISAFARVPYSRMRACLRALLEDPLAAEAAVSRRARDWKEAVRRHASLAAERLIMSDEWQSARSYLESVSGAAGDLIEIARSQVVSGMRAFEGDQTSVEALEQVASAKLQGGRNAAWTVPLDEVKEAIRSARAIVKATTDAGIIGAVLGPSDAAMVRQASGVRRAYRAAKSSLDRAKRDERLLDFADLEECALRALSNAAVQQYYHERWKAFLVDEYQDTNRVQAAIMSVLCEGGARLAVVGDPNQSIYGFRRADPQIFSEERERIVAAGGECSRLGSNYRTHQELLRSINTTFAASLAGGQGGYEPQSAVRDHPGGGPAFVRRIAVSVQTVDGPAPRKSEQQRAEAIGLARTLVEMREAGTSVYDRSTASYRGLRWGDIAVLATTWAPLDAYADALGSLGVPSVHAGGGNLLETREAQDGLAILRFAADPGDNLALAGVLKGPACSMSDLDLLELSCADAPTWWDALIALRGSERWSGPYEALSKLLSYRGSSSAERLIHLTDTECGISAIISALPYGERRLADWHAFADLVRSLGRESLDAFGAVRALRRLSRRGPGGEPIVKVPRPPVEVGDAVSLMTIHRAKGLEWPVVAVADLCATPRPDSSWMYFDPEEGLALKGTTDDGPLLFRCLRSARSERERAEAARLAYVAFTRSRDYLLLTSTDQSEKGRLDSAIADGIRLAGIETEMWAYNPEDAVPPVALPQVATTASPPFISLGPLSVAPETLPVTGLHEYLACPQRFRYLYVDGNPGVGEGSPVSGRIGTLVHLAIQHALMDVDELRSFDRALSSEHLNKALAMANAYRNHPAFARLRGTNAKHEVAVSYRMGGFTLSGRIDLLGQDFLADFKTGRRDSGDRYELQLWLYGLITGRQELLLAYLADLSVVEYRMEDLTYIGQSVEDILAGVAKGDFRPTPSEWECARCRFLTICEDGRNAKVK